MRTLRLLAPLLLLAMAGCYWNSGSRFRADTTVTEHMEHVPGSALVVKTQNGHIEIVAAPEQGDVSIEAVIRCTGETQQEADERLAATTLSVTREADQALVVAPVFPAAHNGGGDGASIVIRLPDANGAELDTSNGSVTVRGLTGNLVIDTSNGRIEVSDHVGPANVDTSNGSVVVTNHTGRLYVDTSNGSVHLTNIDGRVNADTSNGSVVVTLAPGQIGPLDLDTSNGSITVQVGPAFEGAVTLQTANGAISVDDPTGRITSTKLSRNRGRIVVGSGGEPSKLDTSNGGIRITIGG